ncbi:MAG: PASTA domain-containing protein, partial [Rikenellaceae bacterium]|nr:PASTA domain-containing protein [Rikenellaceae bacterium]
IKVDSSKMPNVKGMGLRDAVSLLEGMGLKVSHSGKGSVVNQSPAAGSRIKRGNSASLTLQLK